MTTTSTIIERKLSKLESATLDRNSKRLVLEGALDADKRPEIVATLDLIERRAAGWGLDYIRLRHQLGYACSQMLDAFVAASQQVIDLKSAKAAKEAKQKEARQKAPVAA